MRTLILSDIHANLPAFDAVLSDAASWDNVIFLGDIANFGPNPCECVDLLRSIDACCIMGNHDYKISNALEKRNFWDEWSREQLSDDRLKWIGDFKESSVYQNNILLLHGIYDVDYDILPNTSNEDIKRAFDKKMEKGINEVWFGHYHYQTDITAEGKTYRCIRPVGHHRDGDIRAGYSIYENGTIYHFRVAYDIEKTIYDTRKISCLTQEFSVKWEAALKKAYSEELFIKDIRQMDENNKKHFSAFK